MHERWFASTAALVHPGRCIPQFELISYPLIFIKANCFDRMKEL